MADIITIELGFRQQVAAEALKNIPKRAKTLLLESAVLAHLRRQETEPQPLEIKIINAKEVFSPAKILSVKRDESGQLSGATIEPIS